MSVAEATTEVVKASPRKEGASAKPHLSHHDERVATRLSRDALALERFQFLLKVIYGLVGLLFVSVCANVYFGVQETSYRYFAVDPSGKIQEVRPLDKPIQSPEELLNWATASITRAFTMSFANYRQQMAEAKLTFTDEGWAGFEKALKQTGVIDTVIENKLVTYVVPQGAPVVISQGVGSTGAWGWRVELPLIVTYESASAKRSQNLMVEAVVLRRPETEHPSGLGIDKIIAR